MTGRVWQYIQRWFYLEPLYLPLIVRALGLIGLCEGLKLWNCCFISAVPFVVPAWRVNEHLVNLPLLPMPCNVVFFCNLHTGVSLFFCRWFQKNRYYLFAYLSHLLRQP